MNRRLFSQNGYCVALIARRADLLAKTANSVNEHGGEEVRRAVAICIYLHVDSLSQRLALSQSLNTQKALSSRPSLQFVKNGQLLPTNCVWHSGIPHTTTDNLSFPLQTPTSHVHLTQTFARRSSSLALPLPNSRE